MKYLKLLFSIITTNRYFTTLLVFTGLILIHFISQNTQIGFLQLYSIDEYVFHGSARHMIESAFSGNLSGIFGYGFYQYGFIYFFINALAMTPGVIYTNYEWAIIAPRVITIVFSLSSMVAIYMLARLYLSPLVATFFAFFFVSMPAFWYNSIWFHPDWPMTFFLIGFVYFLTKDNWSFGKNYKLAILFFGLAVAFKYQAIMTMPLLFLYIYYDSIRHVDIKQIFESNVKFIKAILTTCMIFIICNPYVLHPMGWNAFSTAFTANMKSNATNHGSAIPITNIDKINLAIGDFYINILFLFILILGSFWLSWLYIKNKEKNIFIIIAINFLVSLSYLVFFVNKSWQVYYLSVITLGLLSAIYFIKLLPAHQRKIFVGIACIIQLVVYLPYYFTTLTTSRDSTAPDYSTYNIQENIAIDEFLVSNLKNYVDTDTSILLSPYTPFSFNLTGLKYEQVNLTFGAIDRGKIDPEEYLKGQKNYWGTLKSEQELLASFSPVNIIIIRKDIPFFSSNNLELIRDKEAQSKATEIVKELYNGDLGYSILAENNLVIIFIKK